MTPEIEKRIKVVQAGRVPTGYCSVAGTTMPKEWNLIKLGSIFGNRIDINHSDYELLSITADKGVIPRSSIADKDNSSEDKSKYKHICVGDIGYNTMRMWQGVCALSAYDGIVSPAYTILAPSDGICASYFAYLFKMQFMINLFYRNSQGLVDDTRCLKYEWFKNIEIKIPPISEQKKIAEILATQDRVIEMKEKLIAEKQSQKKYLMSVLLGDDFKKPFKLNGVTIDKKKWEKKKLGDICDTFSGGTPSRSHPEYFNGDIPWIKSGELNQENIYETEEFLTKKGIESSSAKMVKKGTLLIAMYGATAGVLAVSHIDAAINQAILALIPNIDINPFYLKSTIANQIDVAVHRLVQGGQPNFNASIINAFELRLPTLPEQKAIADVLSAADEEISLLQKGLEQEKLKKKSLMQLLLTGLVRVNE